MLRTCGDYVEDMLIFAQCSINILSNHHKVTSTESRFADIPREGFMLTCYKNCTEQELQPLWMRIKKALTGLTSKAQVTASTLLLYLSHTCSAHVDMPETVLCRGRCEVTTVARKSMLESVESLRICLSLYLEIVLKRMDVSLSRPLRFTTMHYFTIATLLSTWPWRSRGCLCFT